MSAWHRDNPDSEECQRMTRDNERAVFASKVDSKYPPEKLNARDMWETVKQFTGTNSSTLEQTLDAFKAAGISEGAWDGAFELIEESGLVIMDEDCTFTEA